MQALPLITIIRKMSKHSIPLHLFPIRINHPIYVQKIVGDAYPTRLKAHHLYCPHTLPASFPSSLVSSFINSFSFSMPLSGDIDKIFPSNSSLVDDSLIFALPQIIPIQPFNSPDPSVFLQPLPSEDVCNPTFPPKPKPTIFPVNSAVILVELLSRSPAPIFHPPPTPKPISPQTEKPSSDIATLTPPPTPPYKDTSKKTASPYGSSIFIGLFPTYT